MSEGLGEMKGTMPGLMTGEEYFASQNVVSESEVQFSPQEQELIAKLIAEGKFAAEQIAAINKDFGPPIDGYYTISSIMSPHDLDLLARSLKENNIPYTNLPKDALTAIKTLGLVDHFESGRTSAVTDKNLREGRRIFSAPLFYQKDDIEIWNKYKEHPEAMRRIFFLNQIHKLESLQALKKQREQGKSQLDPDSENFAEEKKSFDDAIESLDGSIRSICNAVVHYVNTTQSSFEDVFPEVSEDLHIFVYKMAGDTDEDEQISEELAA